MPFSPLSELDARRIALIKPSALGDIVHSLPVLRALRRRFTRARISWVVNRAYESLLRGHPDLDETLAFDRNAGWRSVPRLVRELSSRRFDLVIDLQGLLRTGLMCAATLAPRRVGLSTAREGARCFYTDEVRVAEPERSHAVDCYWLIAEALGAGDLPKVFHVPLDGHAAAWAAGQLRQLPRPWLIVAPGVRRETKRWPVEHFAELTRRARQRFGGSAILIGSVDETALSTKLAQELIVQGPLLNLTGATTLPQLAALLARADAVLANDSGPLHLATALGRPVVAPYTCTTIARHGPYGQSGAVATQVWCAGSYRKRCGRLECLAELTPDRLWPALDEVLMRWRRRCRSA